MKGFLIHSVDGRLISPWEYLPCSAITPKIGLALKQVDGELAIAEGSSAPTYICMCEKDSTVKSGDIVPVIRVADDIIFETTLSENADSLKLGDKVTLSADGMQVTSNTTEGVAEIVYIDGTEAGSAVRVRFLGA